MSRREWEEGTIRFGSREWKPFRDTVIGRHNDMVASSLKLNLAAYEALKSELCGRGNARDELAARILRRVTGKRDMVDVIHALCHPFRNDIKDPHWLDYEGVRYSEPFAIHGFRKPLQKDYAPAALSKNFECAGCESTWSMSLNNKTRELHWLVEETNHAVTEAHAHPFTKALFSALDSVSFSRGNGGKIVGNDENNQDANWEGGGANYVTREYSPGPSKNARSMQHSRTVSPVGGGYRRF